MLDILDPRCAGYFGSKVCWIFWIQGVLDILDPRCAEWPGSNVYKSCGLWLTTLWVTCVLVYRPESG